MISKVYRGSVSELSAQNVEGMDLESQNTSFARLALWNIGSNLPVSIFSIKIEIINGVKLNLSRHYILEVHWPFHSIVGFNCRFRLRHSGEKRPHLFFCRS